MAFARELRHPRRYRLLAAPPFTVKFPSVTYRVAIVRVQGCPQWRLEAQAGIGRPDWTLCHAGEVPPTPTAWLEREIYGGFDVMHPTAASTIMERLCRDGRAERIQ